MTATITEQTRAVVEDVEFLLRLGTVPSEVVGVWALRPSGRCTSGSSGPGGMTWRKRCAAGIERRRTTGADPRKHETAPASHDGGRGRVLDDASAAQRVSSG